MFVCCLFVVVVLLLLGCCCLALLVVVCWLLLFCVVVRCGLFSCCKLWSMTGVGCLLVCFLLLFSFLCFLFACCCLLFFLLVVVSCPSFVFAVVCSWSLRLVHFVLFVVVV